VYENVKYFVNGGKDIALLLCVSGGVDSMAMLHLMAGIKNRFSASLDLRIEVINFNHKLRPEADNEKLLVEKWAQHYQFPFHYRERDPGVKFNESSVPADARR